MEGELELPCPWTFYYFARPKTSDKGDDYEENVHTIAKVSTVEQFWHYYSHILRPDQLEVGISLQLFRNDTKALWESPENKNGGSFLIKVYKNMVNYLWEQLVIRLVGEHFPSDVVGISISIRNRVDLIYVWNQTASDEKLRLEICTKFQELLKLPQKTTIDYTPFSSILQESWEKKQIIEYVLLPTGPVMRTRPKHYKVKQDPKQPRPPNKNQQNQPPENSPPEQ